MQFRFTIAGLMTLTAVVAVVLAIYWAAQGKRIVEPLTSPVAVVGWDARGIELDDGRIVLPSGILSLPTSSSALSITTRRGVEVAPDGRVFVQVSISDTCTPGTIAVEIRRVDLALLLEFLQESKPVQPVTPPFPYTVQTPSGGTFYHTQRWHRGEFSEFTSWSSMMTAARRQAVAQQE